MGINLGAFDINSGKVVVSDPCYTLNTWCKSIVDNVANGTWVAEVKQSDEGSWGIRNAELIAYHKTIGKPNDDNWAHHSSNIGVDSGQAGFYDIDNYRKDDIAKDKEKIDFGDNYDTEDGDIWYRYNCYQTLEGEHSAGVIEGGVVSSSGYGDGMYDFWVAIKEDKIVGLKLTFMGQICGYCEEYECNCSHCDHCGFHEEDCDCEFCDDCHENELYCYCNKDE